MVMDKVISLWGNANLVWSTLLVNTISQQNNDQHCRCIKLHWSAASISIAQYIIIPIFVGPCDIKTLLLWSIETVQNCLLQSWYQETTILTWIFLEPYLASFQAERLLAWFSTKCKATCVINCTIPLVQLVQPSSLISVLENESCLNVFKVDFEHNFLWKEHNKTADVNYNTARSISDNLCLHIATYCL